MGSRIPCSSVELWPPQAGMLLNTRMKSWHGPVNFLQRLTLHMALPVKLCSITYGKIPRQSCKMSGKPTCKNQRSVVKRELTYPTSVKGKPFSKSALGRRYVSSQEVQQPPTKQILKSQTSQFQTRHIGDLCQQRHTPLPKLRLATCINGSHLDASNVQSPFFSISSG